MACKRVAPMRGVLRRRCRARNPRRRPSDALFAMFATTKRFSAATELINNLEPKPLSKILGRLLVALPDKVRARDNHTRRE